MKPKYRVWIKKDKKHYPVTEISWLTNGEIHIDYDKPMSEFDSKTFHPEDHSECTLESLTGEHDRNGKEIFEGDRVESMIYPDDLQKCTVYFENGAFWIDHQDSEVDRFVIGEFPGAIEIIGHIHEEEKT